MHTKPLQLGVRHNAGRFNDNNLIEEVQNMSGIYEKFEAALALSVRGTDGYYYKIKKWSYQ